MHAKIGQKLGGIALAHPRAVAALVWTVAGVLTVTSAIAVKEAQHRGRVMPLRQLATPAAQMIEVSTPATPRAVQAPAGAEPTPVPGAERVAAIDADETGGVSETGAGPSVEILDETPVPESEADAFTRWFDGRPIRPARVVRMRVTGYSPGAESCYPFDDGMTATLHSVETNRGRFVAADTRLLPFGSLVSVPGYHDGEVVPVLDRGGAIKGYRLDLMFPTARRARQWGVQDVEVMVWEYADGGGRTDPRKVR